MEKTSKLIAMVIFSCFGISYGAEYDIKTITTIMDAYEKQVDSIKLIYSCESCKLQNGKRQLVKGVFAQKKSDGYVLLDEKWQIGEIWDDKKQVEGIVRAYNGQSTSYFEHHTNKHGYHSAALYEKHDPKLYKTRDNPYYRVWHVNYKTKFTDLLKDPNAMATVQRGELVDGFKTIKIAFKGFNGSYDFYLWLLPEKNYLPIKFQSFRITDGRPVSEMHWGDYKKFTGNIWYPMDIKLYIRGNDDPTVMKAEEIDFTPLTKKDFEFKFPEKTHVTDHIADISYVTTPTRKQQSEILDELLEQPLINIEKEEVLDQYIESHNIDNTEDLDIIEANGRYESPVNIEKKNSEYAILDNHTGTFFSKFCHSHCCCFCQEKKSMKKVRVLLTFLLVMKGFAATTYNQDRLYDCAANCLYLFCSLTNNKISYDKSIELLPMTDKGSQETTKVESEIVFKGFDKQLMGYLWYSGDTIHIYASSGLMIRCVKY